jgi:hypothetical protein
MIPEAILACALAVPVAFVPEHDRHYDVGIFQFMVNHYHKYHPMSNGRASRAYLFGGDTDLLLGMRRAGIEAWRVTIDPETPFDVVAFADAIPFRHASASVAVYMLEVKHDTWGSMKLWLEATNPLVEGGIIAFYHRMSPHFSRLAEFQKWERMPFEWYGMEIWRKPGGNYGGGGRRKVEPIRILGGFKPRPDAGKSARLLACAA